MCIRDSVYIGVLCNELAQALHGILVGLGLTHVKGDLVLKIDVYKRQTQVWT